MCKWNWNIGEIWKQAGPLIRILSSSRMCPSPSTSRVTSAAVQDPPPPNTHSHFHIHYPFSLPTHSSPSLSHTSREERLERPLSSGGLRVWVCSAFGCVFVACVACGPVDHSLLLVVGRGTTSMNTSIWIVLGISASPWSKETRGQGFSLSHQHPQGCWAVTSVSW